MGRFSNYQYIEGTPMTERDKLEADSKFWNKGKWDNFIEPLLPKDCKGMTLVEMGCNAGLFLKLAEEKGFEKVIGIESDGGACRKGLAYKEKNGGAYSLQRRYMEKSIDHLPVSDYTLFVNSHYYFLIHDWLNYLDKLQAKTINCIIITGRKRNYWSMANSSTEALKSYFRFWELTGSKSEIPVEDDPHPRSLWSLRFKSPWLERVAIDEITCGEHVQGEYYVDMDKGIDPLTTRYFKILKIRKKHWTQEALQNYMFAKVALYKSIKEDGLQEAIIVNANNRILDGNHRYRILKHLGYKDVIVRKV